jgi:hypothetical protein
MKFKLALAAGVFSVIALASIPQVSSAGTIGPHTPIPGMTATGGLPVEQVQFGYCRYWARVCASRWGRGSWRFARCMGNHGC